MKKILYTFLILFIVLIVLIVFAANSSWLIKKVADKFAPEYKISYKGITGNLFTGVTIAGLKFNNAPISTVIRFSWDPSRLLYKRVQINSIMLEDVDVDTIKALIASFPKTAEDNSASAPFPLVVNVDKIHVTVNPFKEQGIAFEKTAIDIDDLSYGADTLEAGHMKADIDSDIAKLKLDASLRADTLTFENIHLDEVNTTAIMALLPAKNHESKKEKTAVITQKNPKKNKVMNSMIPHYVIIRSLETSLVSAAFKPLKVKHFQLRVSNLHLDTQKMQAQKGVIDLNSTTNLSHIVFHGTVVDNTLQGVSHIVPTKELFRLYAPSLRSEAFGNVTVRFQVSRAYITADVQAKAKKIIRISESNESNENNATPFNATIDSLRSHIVYTLKTGALDTHTHLLASTPHIGKISLNNTLTMSAGNIVYKGLLKAASFRGFDANLTAPLKNFHIAYQGSLESLQAHIESDGFEGYFNAKDLKKRAQFHLQTKRVLAPGKIFPLPEQLKGSHVSAVIDIPLNMQKILPLHATAKVQSNLANIKMNLDYDKEALLRADIRIPEDSLLKHFDTHIKWEAFNPLNLSVKASKKRIEAVLKSRKIAADFKMKSSDGSISGNIALAGLAITMRGKKGSDIAVGSNITSFAALQKTLRVFYATDTLPKVKGKLDLHAVIKANHDVELTLDSPEILYSPDRMTMHTVTDARMVLRESQKKIALASYHVSYNDMVFFSTMPSVITLKKGILSIEEFWLNDALKVTGKLDTKTMKGEILAYAEKFHFSNEMIGFDSKIDLKTQFNGLKTTVTGDITLLGGDIHYDLGKKSFASDSDIVIVQEMKKHTSSPFMDNLSIKLTLGSKKPLVYKQGPVNMKANLDMRVLKSVKSNILVLGSVNLLKGGWYDFQGKRFVLKKGYIYLTGDPGKPILDIEVKYQAQNHVIGISVSGTPEAPVINFSSIPSLSKEQILSIILFDSESGAGSNSSDDMMKMMGGAMAKSALSNMGVKIDHLVLGQHGDVEIGKKLTDKITVIYINDEIPEVELKYRHSPRTESILKFDEISQSYDIVYRRDMSKDDIIRVIGGKKKK